RVQRSAADLVTRMPLTLRRLRTCSSLLPRGHDLLAKALRGDVVERLQHDRVFDLDAVPVDRQSCVRDPRAVERRVCHEAEGPRIGRFGLQALVTFLDDPREAAARGSGSVGLRVEVLSRLAILAAHELLADHERAQRALHRLPSRTLKVGLIRRDVRVRKRPGRTPRPVRSEAASVAESATSREDLLRVQEELTEIGRARRAVEAAAQASPAVELPVDQALPRRLFFGELVVRVANTELELEPLGP